MIMLVSICNAEANGNHIQKQRLGQIQFLGAQIIADVETQFKLARAQIVTFQRQGTNDASYLDRAELPIGRLEIARLENSLNYPEHGVLRLDINGGK